MSPAYPTRLEIHSALVVARTMLVLPAREDIGVTSNDLHTSALDILNVTLRRMDGDDSARFNRRTGEIMAWVCTAVALGESMGDG